MNYLGYKNELRKMWDKAVSLFADFRHMDEDDPDRDQIEDQIGDLGDKRKTLEDELYAKYGCGVDRIVTQSCKQFSDVINEAVQLRDLWDQFDSSINILHPDVVHPVAAEMLLSSPKWFVHMNAPGVGEIHKRNVLKNYEVRTPVSWSYDENGAMIDVVYEDDLIKDGEKEFALDLDVLMFPNKSTIKFDKQLTAPGVCGEQYLSGNEEKVLAIFNEQYHGKTLAAESQKTMIEAFLNLDSEMQNYYKEIIESEFKWLYEVDVHNIPHLYNIRTGISCCGKSRATNTTQMDLFSDELYKRKCKLCLGTKIGRILK